MSEIVNDTQAIPGGSTISPVNPPISEIVTPVDPEHPVSPTPTTPRPGGNIGITDPDTPIISEPVTPPVDNPTNGSLTLTQLEDEIKRYIKDNNTQDITGEVLQKVLLDIVKSSANDLAINNKADEALTKANQALGKADELKNTAIGHNQRITTNESDISYLLSEVNNLDTSVNANYQSIQRLDVVRDWIEGKGRYIFLGVAEPTTPDPIIDPGFEGCNYFCLASKPGTYTNFTYDVQGVSNRVACTVPANKIVVLLGTYNTYTRYHDWRVVELVTLSNASADIADLTDRVSTLQTNVTTMGGQVNAAERNAQNAVTTANAAQTDVTNANVKANEAFNKAATALSTAETAKTTAETANTTASSASTKATLASSTANNAYRAVSNIAGLIYGMKIPGANGSDVYTANVNELYANHVSPTRCRTRW